MKNGSNRPQNHVARRRISEDAGRVEGTGVIGRFYGVRGDGGGFEVHHKRGGKGFRDRCWERENIRFRKCCSGKLRQKRNGNTSPPLITTSKRSTHLIA